MSALLGLLAGGGLASLGGGWWCLRRLHQARYLLDTPTSKIRSAAQGYVELYGLLQRGADEPLVAPLSGAPCLWWRYRIEEYRESGKSRTWRVIEHGRSDRLLVLADGTGECLVDPRGAEIRPATVEVWTGSTRHPRQSVRSGGLLQWLSSGRRYRYIEERLHPGEPLYAIGDFDSRGGARAGLDLATERGQVIREWKANFNRLLRLFDSNGDGRLDQSEWSRVRLAAGLEAEERHRRRASEPVRHYLGEPGESRPFILSSMGEDELAQRFRWQALAGGLLCVAGAVVVAYAFDRLA